MRFRSVAPVLGAQYGVVQRMNSRISFSEGGTRDKNLVKTVTEAVVEGPPNGKWYRLARVIMLVQCSGGLGGRPVQGLTRSQILVG